MTDGVPRPDREILEYYGRGRERDRLEAGYGPLERERTREVLSRVLPPPPSTVSDIGGGAGVHALWLASLGYSVHYFARPRAASMSSRPRRRRASVA